MSGNDLVTTAAPKALFPLRQDAAFRTNAVVANGTEAAGARRPGAQVRAGVSLASTWFVPLCRSRCARSGTSSRPRRARTAPRTRSLIVSTPTGGRPDRNVRRRHRPEDERPADDPPRDARDARRERQLAAALERARAGREQRLLHDGPHGREHRNDLRQRHAQVPRPRSGRPGRRRGRRRRSPRDTTATFTDVLGSLFGVSNGFGAILVTSELGEPEGREPDVDAAAGRRRDVRPVGARRRSGGFRHARRAEVRSSA